MSYRIPAALIAEQNAPSLAAHEDEYGALSRKLARRGVDIEAITQQTAAFGVAVPTWGVGTGGTRFARFPGPGEPRGIIDKLEDCATIHQLARATPTCSPHFPWDKVSDYAELAEQARGARPRLRRRQLQHVSGRAGPAALLQVRLAHPPRPRHPRTGGRA